MSFKFEVGEEVFDESKGVFATIADRKEIDGVNAYATKEFLPEDFFQKVDPEKAYVVVKSRAE